jgi:DNA (cytosine-5)-methyltransferase 1
MSPNQQVLPFSIHPRRLPADARRALGYSPALIDLFAGCGGLSEGFRQAGYRPVYAVEILESPAKSYAANFQCPVFSGPIEDFVQHLHKGCVELPVIDVVVGGPPCQGFSPLGKMSAGLRKKEDHRRLNRLWRFFSEVVKVLRPKVLVTENVPEFLGSEEFQTYVRTIRSLGYETRYDVLRADHYGVPQKRRRAFCIGSRVGEPFLPPPNGDYSTVRDAIAHLPRKPTGEDWHIGRNPLPSSLDRYRAIPPGGNRFDLIRNRPDLTPRCWLKKKTGTTDVLGRLEWDKPAGTIRTEFFKPEKGRYLHPSEDRVITHREAACIQTFPETFIFCGSKIEVARQIGEAVPPRLAREVAKAVTDILRRLARRIGSDQTSNTTSVAS